MTSDPFDKLQAASKAIESFKNLPQGWNGYSAQRIGPKSIQSAFHFLEVIFEQFWFESQDSAFPDDIIPVPNGNIQFEWSHKNWELEIEISPSGTFSYLSTEQLEGKEIMQEEENLSLPDILATIDTFVIV